MKTLSLCALLAGALFAVCGTALLLRVDSQPKPLPLFFPLLWDFAMVTIGTSCVFHCECVRRAAMLWSLFCVIASLAVGAAAFEWLVAQPGSPTHVHRLFFMLVTTAFGVVFAVWQLVTLRRPESAGFAQPAASAPALHR